MNFLKKITKGGFRLQAETGHCVDAGDGRSQGCGNDLNGYQRFSIRNW